MTAITFLLNVSLLILSLTSSAISKDREGIIYKKDFFF